MCSLQAVPNQVYTMLARALFCLGSISRWFVRILVVLIFCLFFSVHCILALLDGFDRMLNDLNISATVRHETLSRNLDRLLVVRKNDYGWDLNPWPQQPETYTDFEVAAILERRTGVRPLCHCSYVF